MSNPINANTFCWHELLATDTEAATRFYSAVVGYGTQPWPDPNMKYTVLTMGEEGVGGLMALPEDAKRMGAPSHWLGTVAVADVDVAVARARELGGKVHMGPVDLPNVGRYAVLADPSGGTISVMSSINPTLTLPDPAQPGRVSWNERWSADVDVAWAFYAGLFGWEESERMDMGPAGVYRLFRRPGDAAPLGGMATKMPQMPVSAWAYYINVEDIDAAANRIRESGGRVVSGPMNTPGGGKALQGMDSQGAMFGLFAPLKA